jgi:RNase P/RNase MRP subunit p30
LTSFIDLSIRSNDCNRLKIVAEKASSMGFKLIGVPIDVLECDVDYPVTIIPRIDVEYRNLKDLRRRVEHRKLLVVIEVSGLNDLRKAPLSRVGNVIRIKPELARYIDKSQAKLIAGSGKILELSLKEFTKSKNNLYKFAIAIRRMHAYDIPYALVSDAQTEYELWHPRMIVGLLELIGVPQPYNLAPITTFPLRVSRRFVLEVEEG